MDQQIRLFDQDPDFVAFAPGQTIFSEGDPGDLMYVVKQGTVDITVHGKFVAAIERGGVIGEMALIESKPRSASAITRTACELVPINRQRFTFLVQQTPFFALQLMSIIASRLRQMDARLV